MSTHPDIEFTGSYSHGVFATLWQGYKPFWMRCSAAVLLGLFGRALLLSNANWIGYWADSFCNPATSGVSCRPTPAFLHSFSNKDYLYLLMGVTALGFGLTVFFRLAFSRLSAQAVSRIYDEVTLRTSRFPMVFFDTTPAGRIITRFSSDYGNVFRLFGGPLAELISIVAELICMVVLVGIASPYFLPIVGFVATLNFLVYRANQNTLRQERRTLAANRSPSIAHFAETVQGASTIRAYLRQNSFMNRFQTFNNHFLNQKMRTSKAILGFSFQMSALTALLLLITGLASYELHASGRVSVGAVGVAFSFITLSGNTIQMFFEWLAQFEEAMVGLERLDNYLRRPIESGLRLPLETQFETDHPLESLDPVEAERQSPLHRVTNAELRFEDVWFRYAPQLPHVLKGISFTVNRGEKLGIVGRTGSGKSSLITALFHLYPLEKGVVRINGLAPDLDQNAPDTIGLNLFRRAMGLIAQEPVLFQGSLRENLSMNGADDAKMVAALDRVGLKRWFEDFDGGLNGTIEERGRNLSLGERQLLCMARCILQEAPIVVMDEATSSVDPQSEEILVQATTEFFAERTQIIVAHRLTTLAGCDRILWLQKGQIEMLGAPTEVLPRFQEASLSL